MELQNKIRWAISTSYAENGGGNLPYREAVNLAREASGELIGILKQWEEATGIPGVNDALQGAGRRNGSPRSGSGSSQASNGFDPARWARGG